MQSENAIVEKSKLFALRIIRLYKFLCAEQNEYILSKQLLRSGTSIGANVKEAIRGQSRSDFYSKINISLKEASETEYWLELLHESGYISDVQFQSIYGDCQEILRILMAISKSQNRPCITHYQLRITHYELRIILLSLPAATSRR